MDLCPRSMWLLRQSLDLDFLQLLSALALDQLKLHTPLTR